MPHPYTADDARAYVTSRLLGASLGRMVAWAVADVETDLLLATVGLQGSTIRCARTVQNWATGPIPTRAVAAL
jgi:hypothetical protein